MIPRDDTAWHEPHEVGNHKMFGTLTVLSYMLETIAPATSWRSRLLDLMEERLPREEWRAMGFGALLIGLRINALNGHTPYQGLRLGPLYDIHELLFFE